MQLSEITGALVFEPNFSYIAGKKQLFMCRSVIADIDRTGADCPAVPNLHIIVCFGDRAKYIANNCHKDNQVTIKGRFLNYNYKDYNGTKHYTDFFLVSEISVLQNENSSIPEPEAETNGRKETKEEIEEQEKYQVKQEVSDEYAINYMRKHGYSMIDESIFYQFEEVIGCYQ